MRLKTLRIANFRSVQYLTVDLPRVCAIVGPNNAGKSNILEALRRVLALKWGPRATHFSEEDVYLRDPDRDIEIDCYFEPPLAYRKLKNAADVEIERLRFHYTRYKTGEHAGSRRLDQICLDGTGERPLIMTAYGKKGSQPKFEPLVGVPQEVRDAVPLIHIGTDRSLHRQLPVRNIRFSDASSKRSMPGCIIRATP